MSMKECIDSYYFRVCEQETMFRDLFGLEELKEARTKYYAEYHGKKTYLEYLIEEQNRKLREQDGD